MKSSSLSSFVVIGIFIAISTACVIFHSPSEEIQAKTISHDLLYPTTTLNVIDSLEEIALDKLEYSQEAPVTPETTLNVIHGVIKRGETLASSFKKKGVPKQIAATIYQHFKKYIDFRRIQPGHSYSVLLDKYGELAKCTYKIDELETYTISKTNDGFKVGKDSIPLEQRTVTISGQINSSLFAAFNKLGEESKLLYAFTDIFGSQIDFNTETRKDDSFTLTFEKYFKEDRLVGYGKILYASYSRQSGEISEAFYYTSENTPGAFFDNEGNEVGTFFLRSPVPVARVTSKFTKRRKHPILGKVRQHLAVDLAAPHGTPIMAAGDGKIELMGWNGGYGNQVIINHGNGYRTHYGHLARFKKGLKKGSKVNQKEVIGYVGSTGLSTGPHVCYRFQENGTFKDPFSIKFKPRSQLTGLELAKFKGWVAELSDLSQPSMRARILRVQQVTLAPETKLALL